MSILRSIKWAFGSYDSRSSMIIKSNDHEWLLDVYKNENNNVKLRYFAFVKLMAFLDNDLMSEDSMEKDLIDLQYGRKTLFQVVDQYNYMFNKEI